MASVGGGGVIGGRQNPTKNNSAPHPLSVIKIFKYCGVGGGGRQNPTRDNHAPLSLSLR